MLIHRTVQDQAGTMCAQNQTVPRARSRVQVDRGEDREGYGSNETLKTKSVTHGWNLAMTCNKEKIMSRSLVSFDSSYADTHAVSPSDEIARDGRVRAEPDPDRDWQLTYSNFVTQAYKYHRSNGMNTDETLKSVVTHMIQHTKWRPSIQLMKTGVPDFYSSDFEMSISGQTVPDMAWWNFRVISMISTSGLALRANGLIKDSEKIAEPEVI